MIQTLDCGSFELGLGQRTSREKKSTNSPFLRLENSSLVVALLHNFNKWTFLYRPSPEIRDRNLQQEISYRILKLFMFSTLNKIS